MGFFSSNPFPGGGYACASLGDACAPEQIARRSILVDADINDII